MYMFYLKADSRELIFQNHLWKGYSNLNDLNATFMKEIFSINDFPYQLRPPQFSTMEPKYKIYGFNTVTYRCRQIWNSIPDDIKSSLTLNIFKNRIKNIRSFNCTCDLCKTYIQNLANI